MKLTEDNFYKSYDDITNTDILVIESVYDRDQVEKQILENQEQREKCMPLILKMNEMCLTVEDVIKILDNYETNQRLREVIKKNINKILEMNTGDYVFYARQELRNILESIGEREC